MIMVVVFKALNGFLGVLMYNPNFIVVVIMIVAKVEDFLVLYMLFTCDFSICKLMIAFFAKLFELSIHNLQLLFQFKVLLI